MSEVYNYYYIGEEKVISAGELLSDPVVLTFSKMKNGLGKETEPHIHPYMEFFWFESGSGWVEFDDERIPITAGMALFISAGKRHMQYSDSDPIVYYCFSVTDVVISSVGDMDSLSHDGYLLIDKEKGIDFYSYIVKCKAELDNKKAGYFTAVAAYFRLMLVEVVRTLDTHFSQKPSVVDNIKTYIEERSTDALTLNVLCEKFYISKSNLLHLFKNKFGTTPIRYLNFYRIERAKKYLADGNSITNTAMLVGFSNPVYFSEQFRAQTGLTPSAFKKIAVIERGSD